MSMMSFRSGASHSCSSMSPLVSSQEGSRNFRMYSLSYRRGQKRHLKIKCMQYGAFYHTFTWSTGNLQSYNVSRFCFALDVSCPLLSLEQAFFNEQHSGNGEIT